MADRVPKCPNCGAAVTASRFARVALCDFCHATVHLDDGVLSAARFREALQAWRMPATAPGEKHFEVAGDVWIVQRLLAHGEISDVYDVLRARWPGERGVLHALRDPGDAPLAEQAWAASQQLVASDPGARLPLPIVRSASALVFRAAPGFEHTLQAVRAAFPKGVSPRVAVWMWRRLLETLALLHRENLVHGAVLPPHVLVERGDHGVRLVGLGCAAKHGQPLLALIPAYARLYPDALRNDHRLAPEFDVQMSARCITYALGASETGALPAEVPGPFAELLGQIGSGARRADAWPLREELGALGRTLFGPPSFNPLVMP